MRFWLVVLVFLTSLSLQHSFAEALSDEAHQIIEEMEKLYRGDASRATITMTVVTPRNERRLRMSAESLGQEYALYRILAPKKEEGIATLKREKEMWNYFPKINKVIKVPPSMMMGSWMGSDVTNDDLLRETELVDAYDLSLETTEDQYRITLVPKEDTVTVWGRIDYMVDRHAMLPVEQVFFDERGRKIRRMEFSDVKEFEGKRLPSILKVIPLNKEGHETVVEYEQLDFDATDVTKDLFTRRNLTSRF
ncbi:MAG TPA: outer membrane lipoprotein-sorting protein [Gammaproteobacteria bacterium]|nr:outer membrane lipoprotein-sorting protein [Gammaproteobacteria bacterium]|tara:strand:- start:84 stop:833 length:750 start_codon:yes stop_codon:yes gene_type:complete